MIKNPLETIKTSSKGEEKAAGGFNCYLKEMKSFLGDGRQQMETGLKLERSWGTVWIFYENLKDFLNFAAIETETI